MVKSPAAPDIILFDGTCLLCNGAVQWIIRHDPAARFRFASLQSSAGQSCLHKARRHLPHIPDSMVVVAADHAYVKSAAILHIARHLPAPWSWAACLVIVPAPWRDAVYDWVARHRQRWFGRTPTCMLPNGRTADRLLEDETDFP